MELYHFHLVGNYDNLYTPNSEFNIDGEKFKNRLWRRVYRHESGVDVKIFPKMMDLLNSELRKRNRPEFDDKINPGELIDLMFLYKTDQYEQVRLLRMVSEMLLAEGINLREMAMEEYRKQYAKDKPSRLHSLFACTEEAIPFWNQLVCDGNKQLYRIEVEDEPFVSNELLLPPEELNYGEKIMASAAYFHPSKSELHPESNEYLVTGRVKIKERVL